MVKNPFPSNSNKGFSEVPHYGGEWATDDYKTSKVMLSQEIDSQLGCIGFPNTMQVDTTSQEITTANTPQVLTFNTDIDTDNMTKVSSSRFRADYPGEYLITFSGIADLKGGANKHIEVWLRVNGLDIAWSNTRVQIPSANTEMTVAVSFIQHLNKNDYFELWTAGDVSAGATGIQWITTTAGSTAGGVGCPSVIMTCNKISKIHN